MDWIEVTIKTTTEGADIAAQFFYEVGVLGVVIEDPKEVKRAQGDDCNWDYIDDSILQGMDEEVLVKGYLNDDAVFLDKYQYIKDRAQWVLAQGPSVDLGSFCTALTNVKEEDWANNWKKYYKPLKVSDRIVIKPTWEDYHAQPGEYVLSLDPGMAFGTGTHETTVLCIRAIDKYMKKGASILDIGCGTGVLAVAGLLMGGACGDAVDIDGNAVRIASQNAVLNSVDDRLNVIHGDLLDNIDGKYDVVTANIIADIIIILSGNIMEYMKPGGIFIASGIILERLDDVIMAVKKSGLRILASETMGEWAAVVSQRDE